MEFAAVERAAARVSGQYVKRPLLWARRKCARSGEARISSLYQDLVVAEDVMADDSEGDVRGAYKE